ncbi:MAG: hypothetical protein GEU92_16525 [Alphaproteobacteria bacterium]|nr:hypothetical protein [Alphaproteobacteria bacterium]
MKTAVTIVVLLGLLALAIYAAVTVWTGLGDVEISTAGTLAMVAGVVLSLAVGGGLMFLVFWSSRHGHDDSDR